MENSCRLIWIRASSSQHDHEQQILNLMAGARLVVIGAQQALEGFSLHDDDLIVVNATGPFDDVPQMVRILTERGTRARILVRCEISSAKLRSLERSGPFGLLDALEGPDLTRARIAGVLAENANRPAFAQRDPEWRKSLIGRSPAIEKVSEVIRLVGPRRCTVLVTGETGTGKEVVARAIHKAGPRAKEPFIALNCTAVPAPLLEAELFGHTKGAFTGAFQSRTGRFEQADGGTLFLDEIGDIPLELQAKLLRVLQEREIQKLGSSETVKINARVIAATNCDLRAKIDEGSFREDLYYRLNVVSLKLPPLRARISDVRSLAEHFLGNVCREEQLPEKRLTTAASSALEIYDWPGNVRQLENAISSAVILSEDRPFLDEHDFNLGPVARTPVKSELLGPVALPDQGLDFTRAINDLERQLLSQALRKTNGNKKAAAQMLRLKRTTLSAKVRVLDLQQGAA